jgi:hypothetical protein
MLVHNVMSKEDKEPTISDAHRQFKSGVRQMCALGDYHAFATQTICRS